MFVLVIFLYDRIALVMVELVSTLLINKSGLHIPSGDFLLIQLLLSFYDPPFVLMNLLN